MKRLILYFIHCVMFFTVMTISRASYAQGPGFEDDVDDEAVPIDGGTGILAAAGVAYAIKRFKDAQKAKTIPADKLK